MSIDNSDLSPDDLVRLPGDKIEEQSFPNDFDAAFDDAFPAPEPREKQKPVVRAALEGLLELDKDVIVLDAPPGFGKSITLYTILEMLDGKSYYTTPLKSLQDQLDEDRFIGDDVSIIKGRTNYPCILDDADEGETYDVAKCQRDSDFECPKKSECPYPVARTKAQEDPISVLNMSYLMTVPMTMNRDDGMFCPRDSMVVDECQGIDSWAINFVGTTVSINATPEPVWKGIEWPDEEDRDDYETMVQWLEDEVLKTAVEAKEYIESAALLDKDEVKEAERIDEFIDKIERFLDDQEESHWVHDYDVEINKNAPNRPVVKFKPILVDRFLDDLMWNKTGKVIVSSATVPKGDWLSEIGLGDKDVRRISVSSPFPVENRPIIASETVGKMTYDEREDNMPKAVRKIRQIADHHDGEKGIVHCRGYNYIDMFRRSCVNNGHRQWFKDNVVVQDRHDREGSLEQWINGDKQIFLSVNMAEGIDLYGDRCRWQALLKTKYPSMNDERVRYRVEEMNDWGWYNNQAVIQIEQAYGRAVRSKEDHAVFYILDESAVDLVKRNRRLFHDWFLEAIDIDV